ncbi:MAG TPA: CocE/NonD family hydrolase [Gemmatimonadaceae bacterium]|nr:CocE/NonD family hydrolase [Gemmatimonadaceae bacterium]
MASTSLRCISVFLLLAAPAASAQTIDLPAGALRTDSALSASMPRLAASVIANYRDPDQERYLDNLFRLQLAAGQYAAASDALIKLRSWRLNRQSPPLPIAGFAFQVYAAAKQAEVAGRIPFDSAFKQSFQKALSETDDRNAAHAVRWVFGTSAVFLGNDLKATRERHQGALSLSIVDAIELARKFAAARAYGAMAPLVDPLLDEDDRRRYVIDRDILVRTPDGANICVLVVRPRNANAPVTALLNFTIYSAPQPTMYEARRTASHGYAGVEGFTRGKSCSPDKAVPAEHDGADARAVIEWITRQSWSDGKVGMYGGSYEGFTQWAAAKRLPKALKAMMPSVSFAPAIDFPMERGVFMNYAYPWPFYTTNAKNLDDSTYFDRPRWQGVYRDWYVSGRAYRDLENIHGKPNPIFNRWVDHPSYDVYWRGMIPYKQEFAAINIPVLTTTGYYDGQLGPLHYFREHHRQRHGAEHYLIIGPYDHVSGQRGTRSPLGRPSNSLRGYVLDSIAHIDLGELRYEWFNYVFRGAPKPALLKNVVNYQVMGANVWKHAPSIAAMHDTTLRLYLSPARSGGAHSLSNRNSRTRGGIEQVVNLADRSDVTRMMDGGDIVDQAQDEYNVVDTTLKIGNALHFVSEPFAKGGEVSGFFSGRLEFDINKKDFDFAVTLYELTSKREYMHLSYYWTRASHAASLEERRLLVPGKRNAVVFKSGRLTSRQLQPGSRLVVVLSVLKQMTEQINYGTGKDVATETIADAKEPLRIRWFGESFIDIPMKRAGRNK